MPSACRLKSLRQRNIKKNQKLTAQLYAKPRNRAHSSACTTHRQLYKLLHKIGTRPGAPSRLIGLATTLCSSQHPPPGGLPHPDDWLDLG